MKKVNIILWILLLVLVDQGSKLIIANCFIDTQFYIIEDVLGFHPVYNIQHSFLNNLLNLKLSLWLHVILLFCIQWLIIYVYSNYRSKQPKTKLLDVSFIFGQAGLICVFLGWFFWKDGILDFIFLYALTIDLKDIYLNCFVLLFIVNILKNRKEGLHQHDFMKIPDITEGKINRTENE